MPVQTGIQFLGTSGFRAVPAFASLPGMTTSFALNCGFGKFITF
jgi:hypothetical protein